MVINTVNVSAEDAMGQLTIHLRLVGLAKARIRLAVAMWLLRLAGWVSPTKVEVTID